MSLEQFLNVVACIALILFGVYALVRPYAAAQIAHLKPDDATGSAEIRISFGGLSLMMGIAPLVLNDPAAYQVVAMLFSLALLTTLAALAVQVVSQAMSLTINPKKPEKVAARSEKKSYAHQ